MKINKISFKVIDRKYISREDTLRVLGVSENTLYLYVRQERLKKYKYLNKGVYLISEVRELLKPRDIDICEHKDLVFIGVQRLPDKSKLYLFNCKKCFTTITRDKLIKEKLVSIK